MPSPTPLQEELIKSTYKKLGTLRGTARETGFHFSTVKRIIDGDGSARPLPALLGGGSEVPTSPQEWGNLLAQMEARLLAKLASCGPVNEGPPAPQGWAPPEPAKRVVVAPELFARTLWLSDLHFPYHSQPALDAALDLANDWRPNLIVLGGDAFDCYLASRYAKDPARLRNTLQVEFDAFAPTRKILQNFQGLYGTKVVFMLGNHDARVNTLMADNIALVDLRALKWDRMADLPSDWEIVPNQCRYRLGNLDLHHGDLKGRGTGARHIGAWMLGNMKRSTLFGHYHRAQFFPEPDGDGIVKAGFATGHMCDPDVVADYCPINNWTQGFATVDTDPETGLFEVRQHLVHNGRVRHQGRTYGG